MENYSGQKYNNADSHKYLLCMKLQIIWACKDLSCQGVRIDFNKKMEENEVNEVEEEEMPSQLLAIVVFICLCIFVFLVIPWVTRSLLFQNHCQFTIPTSLMTLCFHHHQVRPHNHWLFEIFMSFLPNWAERLESTTLLFEFKFPQDQQLPSLWWGLMETQEQGEK